MTLGLGPAASPLQLPCLCLLGWQAGSTVGFQLAASKGFSSCVDLTGCLLSAISRETGTPLQLPAPRGPGDCLSGGGHQLTPKAQPGHLPVGTKDTVPVSCHSARGSINYRTIKHSLLVDSAAAAV